jgi:hypothetical protein
MTDWDVKINDSVLPLFILAGWLFVRDEDKGSAANAVDASAAAAPQVVSGTQGGEIVRLIALFIYFCLFMIALGGGVVRERMRLVGPFYELPASRLVTQGYFKGLKTGTTFDSLLKEMDRVAASSAGPMFFGPRLEFGYMETARPSPRGLPLWWHPGTSYDRGDTQRVVDAFKANDFKFLVFAANGNRNRMPIALVKYIDDNYRQVDGYAALDVYERKP